MLIMGNDDKFVPGVMEIVLDDLRRSSPSVYLFERLRVHADGSPHPPVEGTDPIELLPGEAHRFDNLLARDTTAGVPVDAGLYEPRRLPPPAVRLRRPVSISRSHLVCTGVRADRGVRVGTVVVPQRTGGRSSNADDGAKARRIDGHEARRVFMSGGQARAARHFGTCSQLPSNDSSIEASSTTPILPNYPSGR